MDWNNGSLTHNNDSSQKDYRCPLNECNAIWEKEARIERKQREEKKMDEKIQIESGYYDNFNISGE